MGDALRHLGVIVGGVILLLILPAIIVGLWNAMSFGQHIGIVVLGIAMAALLGTVHRGPRNLRRK